MKKKEKKKRKSDTFNRAAVMELNPRLRSLTSTFLPINYHTKFFNKLERIIIIMIFFILYFFF